MKQFHKYTVAMARCVPDRSRRAFAEVVTVAVGIADRRVEVGGLDAAGNDCLKRIIEGWDWPPGAPRELRFGLGFMQLGSRMPADEDAGTW